MVNDDNPQCDKHGIKRWYNELGQNHRADNKPAVIGSVGVSSRWYVNGVLHRLDGPASIIRHADNNYVYFWYINGWPQSESEFNDHTLVVMYRFVNGN